jgi:hypothetical protein
MNPTLDLLRSAYGGDDPTDARHGQPDISNVDIGHLSRATQFRARFVVPSATCVASAPELGHRPDVLLRAHVYGGVGQEAARVPSTIQDAAVGTQVFFEVRVASAHARQLFNISRGTAIFDHPNPFHLWGEGENVSTATFGDYSHSYPHSPQLSSPQSGILVQAEYDTSAAAYVAQLQPFAHTGNVELMAAVGVEVKMNGAVVVEQTHATLGLGTFPFSRAGFAFEPVLGSPYSAVLREVHCM